MDYYGKPVTNETITEGVTLVAYGKVIRVERDPAFNLRWTRITLADGTKHVMTAGYHYQTVNPVLAAEGQAKYGNLFGTLSR